MIQRIQTLYLLIVTALVAVMLFAPLAWFAGQAGEYGLYAFSLRSADGTLAQPTLYLGILLALAAALPLVTIFLYRRRLLQIRLTCLSAGEARDLLHRYLGLSLMC